MRLNKAIKENVGDPPPEQIGLARSLFAERDQMVEEVARIVPYLERGKITAEQAGDHMTAYLMGSLSPLIRRDYRRYWVERMTVGGKVERAFARFVRIIINVPVSEAACERMASLLEALFGPSRASSHADLIEDELVIRAAQVLVYNF